MKKYLLGLWIFLLAACQEERLEQGLQSGFLIALSEIESEVETRTAPAGLPDPVKTEFKVTIRNQETDKQQTVKWSEEVVPAEPGTYTLTAEFGENPDLGFDQPYYKGEKTDQTVRDGYTTEVSIPCEVANALVSIRIKEEDQAEFEKNFPDAYVKISVGNVKDQMWTDLNTSAYFKAGSTLSQLLLYKGHETGELDLLKEAGATVPKPFQAKDHLIITLGLQGQNGNLSLVVEKAEIKEENISETIPMEWLPAPKVSATGFDGRNTLTIYETEKASSASIDFNVAQPLQDLYFKLKFEDENLSSLNKGEGAEYQLSEMSEEEKRAFTSAGIILPSIGSTEPQIIFSEDFISKLLSKNDGTVSNIIVIDSVKANDRINKDESPLSYTIAVNKPEFTIDVLDGNVWSKTFTAEEISVSEGRGNLETIKKNLVYQYQETDGTWQDFSNQDARQQVFAEHPLNRNFKVRALYRGELVSNEKDVELESQDQLQNSGMEDWYIETKKKSGTWPFKDKTYYTFHPYADGAVNSSWWDTNNDKAQGGTYALGIWYEGCFASCVSYTEDAHSGSKAALMYLSGCGDGYANTPVTYVGGAMVGSLFIGSYNNGIVQGHDFGVRPTSLTFWYKYKPYNTDAFKVVVSLKNGEKEIATGTYEPTAYSSEDGEYKQASVDFNYLIEDEKATTICVQFLASSKTKLSQSDFNMGTTITYPVIGNWTVHMGSVLKIDDISLVYDK